MFQVRDFRIHLASAVLVGMVAHSAAKASFIMAPMPASLASETPYQPGALAGKPPAASRAAYGTSLTDGLLRTELAWPTPLESSVAPDHVVQDDSPRTVLPEPATIALLGIGLLSLAFLRRAGA